MPEYQITLKKLEPMLIAGVRDTLPTYSDCGPLYKEVYTYLAKKFVFKPAGAPMLLMHDPEYKERDVDIEVAVPLNKKIKESDRVKVYELPAIEVATTVHKGPYNTVPKAYNAILTWCEANGYEPVTPCREIYFTNPNDVKDPAQNVTEIQFPVKKVKS